MRRYIYSARKESYMLQYFQVEVSVKFFRALREYLECKEYKKWRDRVKVKKFVMLYDPIAAKIAIVRYGDATKRMLKARHNRYYVIRAENREVFDHDVSEMLIGILGSGVNKLKFDVENSFLPPLKTKAKSIGYPVIKHNNVYHALM